MFTERNKEQFYWKVSLLFVLISPIAIYALARSGYSPVFHPILFSIIVFLDMPFTLAVDVVLIKLFESGSPLRFWIVKPSDEVRHVISLPAQEWKVPFPGMIERTYLKQTLEKIKSRLNECRLKVITEETGDSIVLAFSKEQDRPVIGFLDHSILGEARLDVSGDAVRVNVCATFNTTLIVESGEFERLRTLCEYLSLKASTFSCPNVPLLLYCGMNLAFMASIITIIPYFTGSHLLITCLAAAAAAIIVGALILMNRKRDQVFGYRLAFVGLFLASLPLASLLSRLFRN